MKTFVVFVTIAAALMPTLQQSCPQDPQVGNPINYVHLFKEQTDLDWDFYNTKTTYQLVYQEVINLVGLARRHRIVFRVTNTNLPVRHWLYMVDIRYDANGFINQIDRLGRVRSDNVIANDQVIVRAFFDDAGITLPAAPGNCCLAKLEYINFYYLFTNYYKDGQGLTQPACT